MSVVRTTCVTNFKQEFKQLADLIRNLHSINGEADGHVERVWT